MPDDWRHKFCSSPDDVLNFINGRAPYTQPVGNAKIAALGYPFPLIFYVFYSRQQSDRKFGDWGWKKSTSPDDALDFINGLHAYNIPATDVEICAAEGRGYREFYIFYTQEGLTEGTRKWGWKRANTISDAINFLNGHPPYSKPATTARIATYREHPQDHFIIFYQRSLRGEINNWEHYIFTINRFGIQEALNRANSIQPIRDKGIEICASYKPTLWFNTKKIHTFLNKGTKIWVQSPLNNERFIQGEEVRFEAIVTRERPCDGSKLLWTSNIDGNIGTGLAVTKSDLSVGNHTITASGYGATTSFPVRVFTHLGDFYQAAPATGEIQRILNDFIFVWENGTGTDENWAPYDNFNFDKSSTDPTKLVIVTKLDVLRHQRFSQPLPMTDGRTIYENLKYWVDTIRLRLDCGNNYGGGGYISLSRQSSTWDARASGTAADPDACKVPFSPPHIAYYIYALQLYVHEGRHSESDDPGHSNCGQGGPYSKDEYLEDGSGYAWAALYYMWVYKYSLYDPSDIRDKARSGAKDFITNRLCNTPTHSNPLVQEIIDELLST